MKAGTAQKISNAVLSCAAGLASFIFSLAALLYLTAFDEKILAALVAGAFCLLISYIASERPNSESARALSALSERLLAVEDGDLVSPAPVIVRRAMPKVAAAVDLLFAEVRASIENAHALGMSIRSLRFPTASISARKPTNFSVKRMRAPARRCCSSISTGSSPSTTALAMPAATSC